MKQELLEILEVVREEKREILEEGAGIRRERYTEGDPFVVTARKMMGNDKKMIQILFFADKSCRVKRDEDENPE